MSETNLIWDKLAAHLAEASDRQIDPRLLRRETSLQDDLCLSSVMVINLVLNSKRDSGSRSVRKISSMSRLSATSRT